MSGCVEISLPSHEVILLCLNPCLVAWKYLRLVPISEFIPLCLREHWSSSRLRFDSYLLLWRVYSYIFLATQRWKRGRWWPRGREKASIWPRTGFWDSSLLALRPDRIIWIQLQYSTSQSNRDFRWEVIPPMEGHSVAHHREIDLSKSESYPSSFFRFLTFLVFLPFKILSDYLISIIG